MLSLHPLSIYLSLSLCLSASLASSVAVYVSERKNLSPLCIHTLVLGHDGNRG